LIHVIDVAGSSRSAVSSKMPFFSAFKAGAFLPWGHICLRCVSMRSRVVPPLLVPPSVGRSPRLCEGIHRYQCVVQPSRGIGGVVLVLCILVLVLRRLVPSLEEWSVGEGLVDVKPSWCVPLYRVYQLS